RPIGDRALNEKLWAYADEQTVALEQRAILEDNGFRVGQVGGMAPPDLQNLLTSEKSLANARRLTAHAGEPKQLPLGAPAPQCRFQIQHEETATPVALEQTEYTFEVVSALTPDGRTRLHFTPVLPHGRSEQMIRPAADRSGLMLANEKPVERYPE